MIRIRNYIIHFEQHFVNLANGVCTISVMITCVSLKFMYQKVDKSLVPQ